jgi:serine/threonine-protein kinase RsbW
MKQDHPEAIPQILGRVRRDEFVGRRDELRRLVAHALRSERQEPGTAARGLLLLLAPLAGVSEFLRQAYDELFHGREVAPIYFALPQAEVTPVSAAIEFLNTFLLQYLAFRRSEPSLCALSLTLDDLVQLAPSADLPWIEELLEAYNRQRFGNNDRELVRFCLSAPDRVPLANERPFIMFDAVRLTNYADATVPFATEIVRALTSSRFRFALAGLRREVAIAVERAGANIDAIETLRLETLAEDDARKLLSSAARRLDVTIKDETRDLLVQQLEGSPFFITALLQGAREKMLALDSYLACERLYVDELMGGRLHRHFMMVLERAAPEPETRSALIRLLCEAVPGGNRNASFAAWRKRLRLEGPAVEALLRVLHVQELVNWDGENVDVTGSSLVWRDYLRSRFRLDALREPRALVVADVMAAALKRAPQTIARHYQRVAGLPLRELLAQFNLQRVPQVLFDFAAFSAAYQGVTSAEIAPELGKSGELQLPQVFHLASGVSFSPALAQFGEERVMVVRGFEKSEYTDASEVVWLVARLESKLAAERALVESWCDRLLRLAQQSGFLRTQLWLIANEGFSAEALEVMRARNVYGSNQQQFELLSARLNEGRTPGAALAAEEFELILPMGGDNELLAAATVEQVARRFQFSPEAINQIKTAVVEACINASEHSLSPDRKIYQRFRVENDKLVITIASRGVVPANVQGKLAANPRAGRENNRDQRRGWGLELIMTLMDEVEFEPVDEGTSLRMTKYRRGRA